jgi:peptidoglycan/xylan/chitin deacetylase (PgdA/CDA1 family)
MVLSSCAAISPSRNYDDFIVVKARPFDSLSDIARRHLHDPAKSWMIAEFNGINDVRWGHDVVVPKKYFRLGGLYPNGYQTVPVLAYHAFSLSKSGKNIVTQTAFESQMRYLKENGYHVITLDQLFDFMELKAQIPKKSVVITIDDGWSSLYDIAYPILKKYAFPATLFVYVDLIGTKKGLSWNQLHELSRNGIDIQNHTLSHRDLCTMKDEKSFKEYFEAVEHEILAAQHMIDENLQKTCSYIAYPYGNTSSLVVELLKKHGYRGGLTVQRGATPFYAAPYRINRCAVYGGQSIAQFSKQLKLFKKARLR